MIRALIRCMSRASSDPAHTSVRYSAALDRLLGRIYRARDLQTPGLTRPPSPHEGNNTSTDWNQAAIINQLPDEIDLPSLLGSKEAPFVAERPLHDLAADMDALFGLAPDDPLIDLQSAVESGDQSAAWPPFDPFASLFSNDDREIWQPITGTMMNWNDMGTM